jgi:pyruvate kinase
MRGVKIVATVGPATSEPKMLKRLVASGTDVVRVNAAHGNPASHRKVVTDARAAAESVGRMIGVLVDLPGPKLRTGAVVNDLVQLESGGTFTLSGAATGNPVGDATRVTTTVAQLATWVAPGDDVFLADGEIVLRVTRVVDGDVETEIVRGGMLRSHKGMHVPSAELFVESFSAVDAAALTLARRVRADFVGVSFVRSAADLHTVRAHLPRRGARPALVAKIETAAALDQLDEIVAAADALMVARGDLGIQVPARRVPFLQKEIIRAANRAGKPVITATQMLESMTRSPLPTRAEVSDIANAVIDGTDALMLSEETAVGDFPIEAVRTMAEVAETAEAWPRPNVIPVAGGDDRDRVGWAVAHASVLAAEDLKVAAILCPTRSGTTARRVAAFRPSMPIIGLSPDPAVLQQLCVLRSVSPRLMERCLDAETQTRLAVRTARATSFVSGGDLVAIVSGAPTRGRGHTDSVRIVRA